MPTSSGYDLKSGRTRRRRRRAERAWVPGLRESPSDARIELTVALFPLLLLMAMLSLKVGAPELYAHLYREDGPIEWATALAFLVAAAGAGALAPRLWKELGWVQGVLYLLLAGAMLFAMLEEIDYGQRLLGVSSPGFFQEHSTKSAINIHNLQLFPLGLAFMAVGFYGSFSRLLTPGSIKRKHPDWVELLTPRYSVAPYFFVTLVLYTYYEYVYMAIIVPLGIEIRREYDWAGHFIIGKDQEVVELLLALGFLLFVWFGWRRFGGRGA